MLFKDSNKIQEFAPIGTAVDFNAVKQIITQAESKHLVPILGPEYTALDEAFTDAVDEVTLTDIQKALLLKCREVIGPYICYYYAPVADGSLTDAGFRRMETSTHKTAYQYQLKNFVEANLKMADDIQEEREMTGPWHMSKRNRIQKWPQR